MLTNTLLIYMTQEALTKARRRLQARKDNALDRHGETAEMVATPHWQSMPRPSAKRRAMLRH